jgi:hypothetical protein
VLDAERLGCYLGEELVSILGRLESERSHGGNSQRERP